jgi:hypothetical protein
MSTSISPSNDICNRRYNGELGIADGVQEISQEEEEENEEVQDENEDGKEEKEQNVDEDENDEHIKKIQDQLNALP